MALETYELDKKMLEYSISQFRNIPEYVKICEAFCLGLATIQTSVDYLSDMIDLEKAEGIWLDYIAWLVGTNRSVYDISQYFCVNAEHLNVTKLFYFQGISSDISGSLQDVSLRKRIRAKVAYNSSKATRNENIFIIKGLTNADKVIIKNISPMVLDITLVGDHILYPSLTSLRQTLESILGNGVGIRNLVIQPITTFYLDVDENDEAELPTDDIYYEINKEL